MKLAYTTCRTCLAIRNSRREVPWVDHYFRALIADGVPAEVLLHAEMEMLHATHHDESALREGESVLMLGFRVILAHYLELDVVPRQEMTNKLGEQWNRHQAEIGAAKQAARDEIKRDHGALVRELRMRVANVEALVSWAFHHGRRKTMRTDEVRAAIEWRTGDEIPEATVEEARRMGALIGCAPGGGA